MSKRFLQSVAIVIGVLLVLVGVSVNAEARPENYVIKVKSACKESSRSIDCVSVQYERDFLRPYLKEIDIYNIKINSTYWRYFWRVKVYQHNGSFNATPSGWMPRDTWWSVKLPRMKPGRGVSVCATFDRKLGKSPTVRKCFNISPLD